MIYSSICKYTTKCGESSCFLSTFTVNVFQKKSHLLRTKAAPSSLHACIRFASSLYKVRFGSASVSRTKCEKDAGLFYTGFMKSDGVIPA
jgi:hypothetical protein